MIAQSVDTNIRELLGILNTLFMKKEILGYLDQQIILETVQDLWIWKIEKQNENVEINNELNKILNKYQITKDELIWSSRKKDVIQARAEFAYIAKNKYWWTLQKIWDFLWGKNHATILHYLKIYYK